MEDTRHAYSVQSERYIDLFGATDRVHAADLALIERHLSHREGAVLDAGCGPGHLTEHLCALGVNASGIDLVPEFVEHAAATNPSGRHLIGSIAELPVADRSIAAILAWYSLIHLPPDDLSDVLDDFRRATVTGGVLVAGFFDGDEIAAFDHKVMTAWFWPVDEFSARLDAAGFTEVERHQRPAADGHRRHASIVAIAA
ncbi:MAG: class I SAM-dependent methyltransferase [Ilumatobacteraceae bacterium]